MKTNQSYQIIRWYFRKFKYKWFQTKYAVIDDIIIKHAPLVVKPMNVLTSAQERNGGNNNFLTLVVTLWSAAKRCQFVQQYLPRTCRQADSVVATMVVAIVRSNNDRRMTTRPITLSRSIQRTVKMNSSPLRKQISALAVSMPPTSLFSAHAYRVCLLTQPVFTVITYSAVKDVNAEPHRSNWTYLTR